VKDPKWLPVLRALALKYEDFPELREMHAYESLQLSAAALTRWYELDPEWARGAVIAEHLLAADNYEIEGNLASLLFRYADGAVLPDVLKEFKKKEGNWAGDTLFQLLAYLLKVDPQTARRFSSAKLQCVARRAAGARTRFLRPSGAFTTAPSWKNWH